MSLVTTSVNGFAAGGKTRLTGGNPAPAKSPRPPMPHISDLTSVSAGVDHNLPIRKLLDEGHGCMRQAETFRNFGRPDVALQEYIRCSIIVVEIIPHHKERVSLRDDRGGLGRLYEALKLKVQSASPDFERIKEEIKADNERTGVQPSRKTAQGQAPGHARAKPSVDNGAKRAPVPLNAGIPNNHTEDDGRPPRASPPKAKPVIHPKPQSLHGNSVKPGRAAPRASKDVKDLNARFASLGGPASHGKQDPRIRTHPISHPPPPPAPRGTRRMPAKEDSNIAVDTSLPNLPKIPDAIYSPARGTVSTEAGQLPSSTPRGLFSRTGSTSSFSGGVPQSQGSSGPPPPRPRSPPPVPPRSLPPIPPGDYLTAEQLADLMKSRSSNILMIDVRPRDDFEEGHILSQATICIEPSVLLRDNVSAEDIAESNILAPAQEHQQFERRDKFEVVVLYDQDSESIPSRPVDEAGTALMSLRRAMLHFSYGRELRNSPKLLKGGVDAWVDFMGPQALRTTTTRSQVSMPRPGSAEGQGALARSTRGARRQSEHEYISLKPEEVKKWEETVRRDDTDISHSPNFVRSTEEFFRRFPPVGEELESMTSPISPSSSRPSSPPSQAWRETGHDGHPSYGDLPSPPTRPAPAVPRPSYSGLGQRYDGGAYMAQPEQPDSAQLQPPAGASGAGSHFTGLINSTGTWCYANSTLQALRMTDGFGQELTQFKRVNNWPPPEIDPRPQLMTNILANLFQWMAMGCFKAMRAQTLMEYTYHISKTRATRFGGKGREDAGQQDAAEYLDFLFTELNMETNRLVEATPKSQHRPSAMQTAVDFWRECTRSSRSIIDQYFTGVEVTIYTCLTCNTASRTATKTIVQPFQMESKASTLSQLIALKAAQEHEKQYHCNNCKSMHPATAVRRFARMPDVLVVSLNQFAEDSTGEGSPYKKKMHAVQFDVDDIDFGGMFHRADELGLPEGETAPAGGNFAPAHYQCYGIVMHKGDSTQSGHYYSYVRALGGKDPKTWFRCNDGDVTKVKIGGNGPLRDASSDVFTNEGKSVPYVLYFRRKGWGGFGGSPGVQETLERGR